MISSLTSSGPCMKLSSTDFDSVINAQIQENKQSISERLEKIVPRDHHRTRMHRDWKKYVAASLNRSTDTDLELAPSSFTPRSAYFGTIDEIRIGAVQREDLMNKGKIFGRAAINAICGNPNVKSKTCYIGGIKRIINSVQPIHDGLLSPFSKTTTSNNGSKGKIEKDIKGRISRVPVVMNKKTNHDPVSEQEQVKVPASQTYRNARFEKVNPRKSFPSQVQRSLLTMTSSPSTKSDGRSKSDMQILETRIKTFPRMSIPKTSFSASTVPTRSHIPIKETIEMRLVETQKIYRIYQNQDIVEKSERRVQNWLQGQLDKTSSTSSPRKPFKTSTKPLKMRTKGKGKHGKPKKKVCSSRTPKMSLDGRPIGPKVHGINAFASINSDDSNKDGGKGKGETEDGRNLIRTKVLPFPQSRYDRKMDII